MKRKNNYFVSVVILIISLILIGMVIYFGLFANDKNVETLKDVEASASVEINDSEITENNVKDEATEEIMVICPWNDSNAKQPEEYTWNEFNALTGEQQIFFQRSFETEEGFELWLEKNDPIYLDDGEYDELVCPWDDPNAKQPEEYTWDEFLALDNVLLLAFQSSFNEEDGFEIWLENNDPSYVKDSLDINYEYPSCPWDDPNAKRPEEYTWDEFLALEDNLQIIFQNSFADEDGFEKWYEANHE